MGRVPLRTKWLGVRLTRKQLKRLDRICAIRERSRSEVVRKVLDDFFSSHGFGPE